MGASLLAPSAARAEWIGAPAVAINDAGRTAVAWVVGDGFGPTGVRLAIRDGDKAASPPLVVSEGERPLGAPRVFVAADGSVRVVWVGTRVDYTEPQPRHRFVVRAVRVSPGGELGAPQDLTEPAVGARWFDAAANAAGAAVVMWDGGAAVTEPGGSFTAIPAPSLGNVAIDRAGNAIAIGHLCTGSRPWCAFVAAERPAGGSFGTLSVIGQNQERGSWDVALVGPGRAVVSKAANGAALLYRSVDGAFGAPTTLGPSRGGSTRVGVAEDGSARVVWVDEDALHARSVAADGTLGPDERMSADVRYAVNLAVAPDGAAVALVQLGGSGPDVLAVTAAGPGQPFGALLPLGESSTLDPSAAVAASRAGTVVAWVDRSPADPAHLQLAAVDDRGELARQTIPTSIPLPPPREIPSDPGTVGRGPRVSGGIGIPAGTGSLERRGRRLRVPLYCGADCRGTVSAGRGKVSFALTRQTGVWLSVPVRPRARTVRLDLRTRDGRRILRRRVVRRQPRQGCVIDPWARILDRRGRAVLFAVASTPALGDVRTKAYACSRPDRPRHVIDTSNQLDGEAASIVRGALGPGHAAIEVEYGSHYGDGSRRVTVADLRGRGRRLIDLGPASIGPFSDNTAFAVTVHRLLLGPRGTVVLTDDVGRRVRVRIIAPARIGSPGGDKVLDAAPDIDPLSLRLRDGVVSWRRAGELRQALLPAG